MHLDLSRPCKRWLTAVLTVGLLGASPAIHASTVWWNGSGADQNWTTGGAGGNWSGSAMPGPADDAIFTHVAGGGSHGTVTNVVPADHTVHTLSYELDPVTPQAFFHTTEIAAGQTLLLTGGLNVSPSSVGSDGNSYRTETFIVDVSVLGLGSTLQVGETGTYTASMIVGRANVPGSHHSWSSHSYGKLDLSGLDHFEANLSMLRLAHGIDWGNVGIAELKLAPSSVISATTIETGRGTGQVKILLGQDNTIRADTFHLNIGKGEPDKYPYAPSEISFQDGLVDPVLNLTGLNQPGVDLAVSYNHTTATGHSNVDVTDLSGGVFNATINELTLGRYAYSGGGGSRGTLIMDAGTVTANRITMAETNGSNPGNTHGTLTMRGGSFTVLGAVAGGAGISTIDVEGGTFASQGAMDVDNLNVGTAGAPAAFQISSLAAGSRNVDTLTLGANGNILLQPNPHGTPAVVAATADLAAGSTVEIALATGSSTDIADRTVWTAGAGTWASTQLDWSNGLPAGYTIATNAAYTFLQAGTLNDGGLSLAGSPGWSLSTDASSATVTRTGGDLTTGPRRAIIDDPAADVARADHLTVAKAAGADAAMLEVKAGQLAVGDAGDPKNLTLGSGAAAGELLQSGGTVTVHGNLASGGPSTVHLRAGSMAVHGDFQVDDLTLAGSGDATLTLTDTGATHTVAGPIVDGGDGVSTLNVDGGTMTVGGGLSVDALRVGHNAGTATAGAGGDLFVTESLTVGAMTAGQPGDLLEATYTAGAGTSVTVGQPASGRVDLVIADNMAAGTGASPGSRTTVAGLLDLSEAGQFNAYLDNLVLGRATAARSHATGALKLAETNTIDAAAIVISDIVHYQAAGDQSRIILGNENIIKTDLLTVGGRRGDGFLGFADGASGGTLQLSGSSGEKTELRIGYTTPYTAVRGDGEMDLSGGTFDATLGEVFIGYRGTRGEGTAVLAFDDGEVTADSVLLGSVEWPPARSEDAWFRGELNMGGGSFDVAGEVVAGFGRKPTGTPQEGHDHSSHGEGTINLSGGQFSAASMTLGQGEVHDEVDVVARGTGTLNISGDANVTVTGELALGVGHPESVGTINLTDDGTLAAPSITGGVGEAHFNFTGGTLHVGTFGHPDRRFDLVQEGGTLAPGNPIVTTEVFGDYTQLAAGMLEIEIAGPTDHDFIMVHGDASLDGTLDVLLDDFFADLGDSFDVLETTGSLTLGDLGIIGDPPNPTFGWWQAAAVLDPGGPGAFLRLTVVPEPGTAILLPLALAGLLCRRRRR